MEKKDIGRYEVQLHNLILNRTLNLPSLDDIVHLQANDIGGPHFLRKAVLSSDPVLSDNFMIMGIMSRFCGLAFFKPVNRSWTSIGYPWSSSSGRRKMYSDVTFIHSVGQFYALRVNGSVFAIKFPPGIGQPKLTKVARRLNFTGSKMYLVEDSATGDLLQVHKSRLLSKKDQNGKFHNVVYFSVFKLDPVERKWIKMRHLGNKILFLGNNSSILRTASDCPGCIPNCIYYTSDYNEIGIPKRCYKPPFAGIYNVEDDSIHPHYTLKKTKKVVPWTIWLEPNFIRCNATLGSASIG